MKFFAFYGSSVLILNSTHDLAANDDVWGGRSLAIEAKIVRVHADESLLMPGQTNRIDPDRWRPLIMSFQEFYGLGAGKLHHSMLGEIPEQLYRPPGARMG